MNIAASVGQWINGWFPWSLTDKLGLSTNPLLPDAVKAQTVAQAKNDTKNIAIVVAAAAVIAYFVFRRK